MAVHKNCVYTSSKNRHTRRANHHMIDNASYVSVVECRVGTHEIRDSLNTPACP